MIPIPFSRRSLLAVLLLSSLAPACGESSDPGDPSAEPVTLDSLPAAERSAFEVWKKRPVKDCAWEEAFPELEKRFPPPPEPYIARARIDEDALLAGHGGLPIITGAGGTIVVLSRPTGTQSTEVDERQIRITVNGKSSVLMASAVRDGGVCTITLGGQEIFRARMWETMPFGVSTSAAALQAAAGQVVDPAKLNGGGDVAAIDGGRLVAHALAATRPDAAVRDVLAADLGITAQTAAAAFPLGVPVAPLVVRPVAAEVTPFTPGQFLFGPAATVAALPRGGAIDVDLIYPGLEGLLALRATLAVNAADGVARTTAVAAGAAVALADAAAVGCFLDRQRLAASFQPLGPRRVKFADAFSGCSVLAADATAALAGDARARALVATETFADAPSVGIIDYVGWDAALFALVDRVADGALDVAAFDPEGRLPFFDAAFARLVRYRRALAPAAAPTLRAAIDRTVLKWGLRNLVVPADLDANLVAALGGPASAYGGSLSTALADIVTLGPSGVSAVACAAGLTGARADHVAALLGRLHAEAHAGSFTTRFEISLFQSCPSDSALDALDAAVAAAGRFIAAGGTTGTSTSDADLEDLVGHALDERWDDAVYSAAAAVVDFAVAGFASQCHSESTAASRAVCADPNFRFLTTAAGRVLSPALRARNLGLAQALLPLWTGALSGSSYFEVRFDIENTFFANVTMWGGCSDASFASAQTRLLGLLDARTKATSIEEELQLESSIRSLVASQTCT